MPKVTIGEESELQPLTLLLAAIEAAEACGIKHEKLSTEIGKGTYIIEILDTQQERE